MSFPQDVKERVLVSSGRCCAICHNFKGNNIEIHHIKKHSDGGADSFENAIPLCFDCHAEVGQYDPKHPKGTKFSENELILHRDAWYKKVENSGGIVSSEETKNIDKITYERLKEHLPYQLMTFIREVNFYNSGYELGVFYPLEVFNYECENPFNEYLDIDLECQKNKLRYTIKKFFEDCVPCIFCDDGKMCRIPLDWEERNPDIYEKYAKQLNQDTLVIWQEYYKYIALCRRKLSISG